MKVKEEFHKLIDTIDDDEMLVAYYNLISQLNKQETGKLFQKLTNKQKQELSLAYRESFNPVDLLSHQEVKSQYEKWL